MSQGLVENKEPARWSRKREQEVSGPKVGLNLACERYIEVSMGVW